MSAGQAWSGDEGSAAVLVVALLACLYVLPHLMWDVLTMPAADLED